MAGCRQKTEQLREQFQNDSDVEIQGVSCLGRCENASSEVCRKTASRC